MNVLASSSSYPLLNVFLTTLWIVGFILWFWLAIAVFSDIFRSRDMSGLAKAAWVVLVFVVPLFGVLIYLIARGSKMRQHAEEAAKANDQANREYIQQVVSTTDTSGEIAKLAGLRDSGALSEAEFAAAKARVLEPTVN